MLTKKWTYSVAVIFVAFLLAIASFSCSGRYLITESANKDEIKGSYTLILYGANYANDITTIAILARQGTPYTFDIFSPDFEYKVIKDVPAREALERAEKFVSFHRDFWKSQLSKILGKKGEVIGYELRPLYKPFIFGTPDVLRVYYKMTDGKVVVYIRPFFIYPVATPLGGSDMSRPGK